MAQGNNRGNYSRVNNSQNRGQSRAVTRPGAASPQQEGQLVQAHRPGKKSILDHMAARLNMDPMGLQKTLLATVFQGATNEEFASLLVVSEAYKLNPLTKEIYAFPKKGGGIMPLVSIDGWIRIINEHPQMAGIEWEDIPDDDGNLFAIECTIHRKDRERPIKVIEYLKECKQNTDPWNKMPARMLRHKSTIQCARYAFGFSGIYDPSDVDMVDAGAYEAEAIPPMRNITPDSPEPTRIQQQGNGEPSGETASAGDDTLYDTGSGEIIDEPEDAGPTPPDHPAWVMAERVKEESAKAANIIDHGSVRARYMADIESMPRDVAESVEQALDEDERKLKGGK